MNYINKLIYIHTRRKYLKKRQNGGCENISPLSIFKNAPEYIDPSGHFVFYKIVCRSNVYNAKYLRQFWINYNNFSSIFLWYLSTNFGRKIFNFNYQQNLENMWNSTRKVESKILYHIIFFSLKLPLVFICKRHFDQFQNQPQGEPREHHLGEVLQRRSKSKFNFTLS